VAVPLLWYGTFIARRGSIRGHLIALGIAGYGIYNYAFYLFGARLNIFFPLYVVSLGLALVTLGLLLLHRDAGAVARSFPATIPVRLIGGYLVFLAVGLAVAWLGVWARFAFGGRPTPIDPEAFKLVAALDLLLMVPALLTGGILLWRRRPWGYLIATIAAMQGALYLFVLTVNSIVAIRRSLSVPPGELPIWAPLAITTTLAALVLIGSARGHLPTMAART
jgi:hypothetical protein